MQAIIGALLFVVFLIIVVGIPTMIIRAVWTIGRRK